jgi:hypothetical protein
MNKNKRKTPADYEALARERGFIWLGREVPNATRRPAGNAGRDTSGRPVITILGTIEVALTVPSWLKVGAIPVDLIGYYRLVEIPMWTKFNTLEKEGV